MKRLAAVLGLTAILTLLTPSPAIADEGCVLDVLGVKVCGTLLTPLPTVTATVKPNPVPVPGPTVRIPGPTVTVPGPTKTVTIPGPTSTATSQQNTTGPSSGPTSTVTITSSPTGQPGTSRATVTPSPELSTGGTVHEARTKTETIVRTILATTLIVIVSVALILLFLFLGFLLGKQAESKNQTDFLESLLDYTKIRRRS